MSYGFYDPPQLQSIVTRRNAQASFAALLPSALARTPAAIASFAVPGIYTVGWQKWWDAGAGAITMDADAAHQCGLGFALGLNPACAAKADAILNAWATTNKGIDLGDNSNNDSPLLMVENGAGFILTDILLAGYSARPPANVSAFLAWLRKVYVPTCDNIKVRINNWGAAGTWGALLARRHLGMDWSADVALLTKQIASMIDGNGVMTQEMLREGAQLWYSYFALMFLCLACRLVRNAGGPDLFRATPNISNALSHLATMLASPTSTTGAPDNTAQKPWPYDLFAAMGEEFNNDAWRAIAAPLAPISYWGHHTGFNVPHLTAITGY